ncbi:hypothetical protein O181_070607 [Austropuccinia psidii MF-1]|uniref:Uncharacterized protein n=1 Tax=Austropuccinia psidii MF-1 TaxID=1389203 RepID=A0A9Q3I8F9_9BASI|nr:hypothetical protein [Austropuccinia psidii MF-1]
MKITEEFSRKLPVFPVSLVKPYHQKGGNMFPSRNRSHTPQDQVEVEESPGPVRRLVEARKIRLNGKDHRIYLVTLKNTTDKANVRFVYETVDNSNNIKSTVSVLSRKI